MAHTPFHTLSSHAQQQLHGVLKRLQLHSENFTAWRHEAQAGIQQAEARFKQQMSRLQHAGEKGVAATERSLNALFISETALGVAHANYGTALLVGVEKFQGLQGELHALLHDKNIQMPGHASWRAQMSARIQGEVGDAVFPQVQRFAEDASLRMLANEAKAMNRTLEQAIQGLHETRQTGLAMMYPQAPQPETVRTIAQATRAADPLIRAAQQHGWAMQQHSHDYSRGMSMLTQIAERVDALLKTHAPLLAGPEELVLQAKAAKGK